MAKGKPTPEKSKIERERPLAYSRRQKGGGGGDVSDDKDEHKPAGEHKHADEHKPADEHAPVEAKGEATSTEAKPAEAKPAEAKPAEAKAEVKPAEAAEAKPADAKADEAPAIEPPPPKGEPWPDATPPPMRPVEPARARTETIAMPAELVTGGPPEMPTPGAVEEPTHMPGPRDIPTGTPTDPAAPPGRVPAGDSRSFRNGDQFALVYRVGTCVITRSGVVGTRGVWRVVEYPTSVSASNSYAKECSRFVSDGFHDYRD